MKTVEQIKERLQKISEEKESLDKRQTNRKLSVGVYTEATDKLEAEESALRWVLED